MKFLVDALLPRRLCAVLMRFGHDATHTLALPAGNKTTDPIINQVLLVEQRVVISKDADFFYSHVLEGSPDGVSPIQLIPLQCSGSPSCCVTFSNDRFATDCCH